MTLTVPQLRRTALPAFLAAFLMVIFSASGLMAGGLTFKLTGGLSVIRSGAPHATATSNTRSVTPTPTPVSPLQVTEPFTLSILLEPSHVRPGQMLSITISALSAEAHSPVVGLRCFLENPTDGSTPLLAQWPAATVTGADGQAHWAIQVPQIAPGTYEIGYGASGTPTNWYRGQQTVQVGS